MDSSQPTSSQPWVFSRVFWSKFKPLLPIVGLAATLPILVAGVQVTQNLLSKATTPPPQVSAKVVIRPEQIISQPSGQPISVSALAYDPQGQPIQQGVTYEWDMSSSSSLGKIESHNDIATYYPTAATGTGDLQVKATTIFGPLVASAQVCQGVPCPTPTPTPTSTPDPKLACSQTGGTWRDFPDSCADTCPPSSPRVCSSVLTSSCDCGASACWDLNAVGCIPNPPSPQPTYSPTPKPEKLPDLSSPWIPASPPPVYVKQQVPITFSIYNGGNAPALSVEYAYTNQDDGYSTVHPANTCTNFTVLDPGQSCVSAYYFSFPTAGKKTLSVKLDPNNKLVESNENNNDYNLEINVLPAPTPTPTPTGKPTPTTRPTPTVIPTPLPKPNSPPVILTKYLPPAIIFRDYKAQIVGEDQNIGQVLKMTISNLPPNIKQVFPCSTISVPEKNQITCQLVGIPNRTGIWRVKASLQDSAGASATKEFLLVVIKKFVIF